MHEDTRIEDLQHAINNCCQILDASNRLLVRALECLDGNDMSKCRELLLHIGDALPQAVSTLENANPDRIGDQNGSSPR